MIDDGYSLALAFDTDSAEFCRGFEAASVYSDARRLAGGEQINEGDEPDTFRATVHVANAEMVLRIAETLSLGVRSKDLADGWLEVVFTRSDTTSQGDER